MTSTTVDVLMASTLRSIDRLVDATIEAEHGDISEGAVALFQEAALRRVKDDVRAWRAEHPREFDAEYARVVLRSHLNSGLAARQCQCCKAFPFACPHGMAVDQRWCGEHTDPHAPKLYDAVLCRACYAIESGRG